MSTLVNDAVNIPNPSTGPKTEAGRATSSRNALRTGLYTSHDFIRAGEEEEYGQTLIQLMDELTPEGPVEQTFATEIMGATWRLRRCRLVEEAFSSIDDLDFDPMMDERTEKQQKSVDRARAQSHLILRRSLAELRNLQEGPNHQRPALRPETNSQAAGLKGMDARMGLAELQPAAQRHREFDLSSFCNSVAPAPAAPGSFCKRPEFIPGNARCCCGSGTKHKRCCGSERRAGAESGRLTRPPDGFSVENSTLCKQDTISASCAARPPSPVSTAASPPIFPIRPPRASRPQY